MVWKRETRHSLEKVDAVQKPLQPQHVSDLQVSKLPIKLL